MISVDQSATPARFMPIGNGGSAVARPGKAVATAAHKMPTATVRTKDGQLMTSSLQGRDGTGGITVKTGRRFGRGPAGGLAKSAHVHPPWPERGRVRDVACRRRGRGAD